MGLSRRLFVLFGVMSCSLFAEPLFTKVDSLSGWMWFTTSRVEQCPFDSALRFSAVYPVNLNKEWRQNLEMGLKLGARLGDHTRGVLHLGGGFYYSVLARWRGRLSGAADNQRTFSPFLLEASAKSAFDLKGVGKTYLRYGYFPIKYNPDVRNLGEYLFRSLVYPGVVYSGFEVADKVKILGLQWHLSHWNDIIEHDIVFRSEVDVYPLYDFSLTYLAHLHPVKALNFSAGVSFDRLIPVDKKKTIPGTDTLLFNGFDKDGICRYIDTVHHDTTNYSFAGTKLVGRIAFDPKVFFVCPRLGKEDLKIYSEIALLGVKNYPVWYSKRNERMPVMFGFNFPAFKILDVLSLECEWYGSLFVNSTENIWEARSPVPYRADQGRTMERTDSTGHFTNDNWKWSVYGSKKVSSFLRLSFQFARDHVMPGQKYLYAETVREPGDWYWAFRSTILF